jgi:hypothetical protein
MKNYNLGLLVALSLASFPLTGCDDSPADGASASGSGGSTSGTASASSTGGETTPGSGSAEGTSTTTGQDSDDTDSADVSTSNDASSTSDSSADGTSTGGVDTDDGTGSSSSGGEESSTGEPTDSGGKMEICEAPGDLMPCDGDTDNLFNAMGLGCEGGPNTSIPIINPVFAPTDATSWRIITQYGTHIDEMDGLPTWRPREGESMVIISTGQLPEPDADGILIELDNNPDSNDNPDNAMLPAPMSPLPGSAGGAGGTPFVNCDGVGDCSDSLIDQWNLGGGDANDLLWFQFETVVPGGTYGYSFDFAYFSEEFPEYVDDIFNDMFVAWSNSESYTGNLCFVNDEPCTVTALWPTQHPVGDPVMEGTQFDGDFDFDAGEATGWFQANGTAVPGELLQVTFAIFDMGDTVLDTTVLLDNFRWDCEGCTPSEVDPCVGIDPV